MIRVVFDTNIIVSALLQPLGPPRPDIRVGYRRLDSTVRQRQRLCRVRRGHQTSQIPARRRSHSGHPSQHSREGLLSPAYGSCAGVFRPGRRHFSEMRPGRAGGPSGNWQSEALSGVVGGNPNCDAPAPAGYPDGRRRTENRVTAGRVPFGGRARIETTGPPPSAMAKSVTNKSGRPTFIPPKT